MNPEVRFRVPASVFELAEEEALKAGLESGQGRSTGVSRLARAALYAVLGLPLPREIHRLQAERFQAVRQARDASTFRFEVHHKLDDGFRREEMLRTARPVPARTTTVFEFEAGSVPDFLAPMVRLAEDGLPLTELNFEGEYSSRPDCLGELVTAGGQATLAEVEAAVAAYQQGQAARAVRQRSRQQQRERGAEQLERWLREHGSELLCARHQEGFEWLTLAQREFAEQQLRASGLEEFTLVDETVELGGERAWLFHLRPAREPGLEAITTLRSLRQRLDPSIQTTLVAGGEPRHAFEAVAMVVPTPLGPLRFINKTL
ncbi:MAG: hypothetical protein AB7S38_43260 [Vulcanimicrobiota bacterium]